jgi:hypothetical protein
LSFSRNQKRGRRKTPRAEHRCAVAIRFFGPEKLSLTLPGLETTRAWRWWFVLRSRQELVAVLRRAGLEDLAYEATASLPDPVSTEEIREFCKAHKLSAEWLMNRLGSSP